MNFSGSSCLAHNIKDGKLYSAVFELAPRQILSQQPGSYFLDSLENLGYNYYLTTDNNVVVYNSNCSFNGPESNLKINVGISFNIICS